MTENDECMLWGCALNYWSQQENPTDYYIYEFCFMVIKEWGNLQYKTKKYIFFTVTNNFKNYHCQEAWDVLLKFLESATTKQEFFPQQEVR